MSKQIEFEGVIHEFPDDFTDADIAKALRSVKPAAAAQKEPGLFDRLVAGTVETAPKAAKAFWDRVNPVEGVKGLYETVAHPIDTLSGIAQAHRNVFAEGEKALERGDYIGAGTAALGAGVPLLGPALYQNYRDLEAGNQAEALGGLAGTLAGLVNMPRFVSKLGSRWVGVPGMDALPPAKRAAVDYMANRGVTLPAHTLGGGELPHMVGAAAAVSPYGAFAAPRMARQTEADLSSLARTMERETLPQSFTPFTAGESTMDALTQRAKRQKGYAQRHYDTVEAAEADPANLRSVQQGVDSKGNPVMADVALPVDTSLFRAAAQDLYDRMKTLSTSARKHTSESFAALEGLLKQPRYIPAGLAEELLSGLKTDLRGATGRDRARLSFLIDKFEPVVDDALRTTDPALAFAIQKARGWTKKQKDTELVYRQITGVGTEPTTDFRLREPEPVNVYRRLTQEGDTRAMLLERLEKMTPRELPKLGRAYIDDILQTWRDTGESFPTPGVAQKMWNDWKLLGDDAKGKMFPLRDVRQNWDHFFEGMREVARNPNPSGTAKMTAATAQLYKAADNLSQGNYPMAALWSLGPSAVAAVMFSDRGAKLLRAGFRIPAGDIAKAAAWSSQVGNLAAELTDEERIRRQLGGKPMLPYEYANPSQDPRGR